MRRGSGGQAFLIVVIGYISKGAVVRGQGADSCEQVGDGGKIREELKRIVPVMSFQLSVLNY
jgi:hypothetical protein